MPTRRPHAQIVSSSGNAPRFPIDRRQAAWLDLRDTAGAVRLAVQLLEGPLNPCTDPAPSAGRVADVITTLERATRRLCNLIDELQPAANDPGPGRDPAPTGAGLRSPVRVPVATPTQPTVGARRTGRAQPRPAPTTGTALDPILRALELHVRSPEHGAIALDVVASAGMRLHADGDELLRVLIGLVQDASPTPASVVYLRAWLDPVEELGEAMDVVLEIRGGHGASGPPSGPGLDTAQASWGPARVAVHPTPGPGRVLVRVPQAR